MSHPYVPTAEVEDLHARLRVLDDAVHDLRRDFKSIQTEWNSQFAKYQALYARLAKQAKRAEERAEDAAGETNGDGAPISLPSLSTRFRRF